MPHVAVELPLVAVDVIRVVGRREFVDYLLRGGILDGRAGRKLKGDLARVRGGDLELVKTRHRRRLGCRPLRCQFNEVNCDNARTEPGWICTFKVSCVHRCRGRWHRADD